MPPYLQANEQGYIIDVTEEGLLVGLFGGNSKDSRNVSESVAKIIRQRREKGIPTHINEISEIERQIAAESK